MQLHDLACPTPQPTIVTPHHPTREDFISLLEHMALPLLLPHPTPVPLLNLFLPTPWLSSTCTLSLGTLQET
jgi:hypothetical protein